MSKLETVNGVYVSAESDSILENEIYMNSLKIVLFRSE